MAEAKEQPSIAEGDLVKLKGLKGAQHLNGLRGRVVKYVKKDKRWAIRLESTSETIKAKVANIEVLLDAQLLDGTPTERDVSVPLEFNVGDRVECLNYHTIGVSDPEFGLGQWQSIGIARSRGREEFTPHISCSLTTGYACTAKTASLTFAAQRRHR